MNHPLDEIGVIVELTPTEGALAKAAGSERNKLAHDAGRTPSHGMKTDGEDENIVGAICEAIVAKYFGLDPTVSIDFSTRHAGDVAGMEVRGTRHRNGRLIVHDDDKDDRAYILVTYEGSGYRFNIRGWMLGRDAKKFPKIKLLEWRPPEHVVCASELHSIELLKP